MALTHCGDGNPITWLQENWLKLVETVQTLATKYGQERKENIVGTISAIEAKEALKKNKGNVWHAVTECIEQRQRSFNFINSQGKYLREDIVTYLTVHHGDRELALRDLSRLQLKPFLLNVIGHPTEADNDSANVANRYADWTPSPAAGSIAEKERVSKEEAVGSNQTDMLKDLETIIGNMEQKQSKQTETILNTIESLLGNIVVAPNRPLSSASNFSIASFDRIDVKSPIMFQQKGTDARAEDVETDVKNFMTRHIQDIVADVATMVDKELRIEENTEAQQRLIEQRKLEEALSEIEVRAYVNLETVRQNHLDDPLQFQVDEVVEGPKASQEQASEQVQEHADRIYVEQQMVEVKTYEPPNEVDEKAGTSKTKGKVNMAPKFVVNKGFTKRSRQQYDKLRIRNLERQLLQREKTKKNAKEAIKEEGNNQQNGSKLISGNNEEVHTLIPVEPESSISAQSPEAPVQSSSSIEPNQVPAVIEEESPETNDEISFSIVITEQGQADTDDVDQSRLHPEIDVSDNFQNEEIEDLSNIAGPSTSLATASLSKNKDSSVPEADARNLSELVRDTKSLIQQMKDEINEDIAMSVSEYDEDTEYYETDSEEYTDYSGEEGEEGSDEQTEEGDDEQYEYEEEKVEEGDSDDWTDTNGESEHSEVELDGPQYLQHSISTESEPFIEAQEEIFDPNEEENTVNQELNGSHDPNSIQALDESTPTLALEDASEVMDAHFTDAAHTTDNLEQNILEIQQSLGSSVLSLRLHDHSSMEKSSSFEPSDYKTPEDSEGNEVNVNEIEDEIDSETEEVVSVYDENSFTEPNTSSIVEDIDELVQNQDSVSLSVEDEPESLEDQSASVEEERASAVEGDVSTEEQATVGGVPDEIHEIDLPEDVPTPSVTSATTTTSLSEGPVEIVIVQPEDQAEDTSPQSSPTRNNIRSTSSPGREVLVESYTYKRTTIPVLSECSRSQSSINILELQDKRPEDTAINKSLSRSDSQKSIKPKNKIPVRKNSMPGTSANIRNIQNELLNKQENTPVKSQGKKPSKIVPPKLYFKSLTNKATDIIKSYRSDKSSAKNAEAKEDRKIPKKKYYETCFSDDYQTSDDEKEPQNLVKPQVIYKNEEIDDPEVGLFPALNEYSLFLLFFTMLSHFLVIGPKISR